MDGVFGSGAAAAIILLLVLGATAIRRRRARRWPVQDIRFDATGWQLRTASADAMHWRSDDDLSLASVRDNPVPRVSDIEALRRWAREEAATAGAGLVSAEVLPAAGGALVQTITKRREGLACLIEGRLILPLDTGAHIITVRSLEHGTTGIREAVVTANLAQVGDLQIDADTNTTYVKGWKPETRPPAGERGGSTPIGGWFQDPYDPDWTGPALYAVADDERLDPVFPDHPLSRARRVLEAVRSTLVPSAAVLDRSADWVAPLLDESQGPRPLLSDLAAGSLLLQMGRPDLAERALAGAMTESSGSVADQPLDLAHRLLLLGLTRDFQGKHADAAPSLERACEIFAASAGERALSTATARSNLARVYVSLGRHTEAEALFTDAMAVFREEDAAPGNTAIALNGLGLIRREAGRYDEAIGLFEQALDLFARQPEIGSGDAVTVLRNLAAACAAKGDSKGARRAMQRALDLERRHADAAAGMG